MYNNPATQWWIVLPRHLSIPTIQYFHMILGHPGMTMMRLTIQTRYYHPMLRKEIDDFACNACQKMKQPGPWYGLLPEQDVWIVPWAEVAVDLKGPWTVKIRGKTTQEVFALTIIDTASNLVELVQIKSKTFKNVARRFHNTWLARYLQPKRVIHSNGGEFTGQEFQGLLYNLGIKPSWTTVKNPQSNAIC